MWYSLSSKGGGFRTPLPDTGKRTYVGGTALLEDFSGTSIRLNTDGTTPLWKSGHYATAAAIDQTRKAMTWTLGYAAQGTSTGSNSSTTLNDTTQSWPVNGFGGLSGGYPIKIVGGTGAGQISTIQSNTATQVTVSPAWTTTPDASSQYKIAPTDIGYSMQPGSALYNYPAGYCTNFIRSGTFNPATANRLTFWLMGTGTVPVNSTGQTGNMEFGNYIGCKDGNQGTHYYNHFNLPVIANAWHKFSVAWKPDHLETTTGNENWPPNPEGTVQVVTGVTEGGTVAITNGSAIVTGSSTNFPALFSVGGKVNFSSAPNTVMVIQSIDSTTQITLTSAWAGSSASGITISEAWPLPRGSTTVNYMEGLLVNWYLGPVFLTAAQWYALAGTSWWTTDYYFDSALNEPDAYIADICGVYDQGSGVYEWYWKTAKDWSDSIDIYMATRSMKTNGLGAGTLMTTLSTTNDVYANMTYTSPATAWADDMYLALKPHTQSTFSEFWLPKRTL